MRVLLEMSSLCTSKNVPFWRSPSRSVFLDVAYGIASRHFDKSFALFFVLSYLRSVSVATCAAVAWFQGFSLVLSVGSSSSASNGSGSM